MRIEYVQLNQIKLDTCVILSTTLLFYMRIFDGHQQIVKKKNTIITSSY